ncbi:MAG: UDP-N-acetylmuramoyl-tripeptide--D-alanyl-D-alanine ligase [Planctomycetota bacterium]|nr:UDP-N-acetylmuramoyl-tripeptide--D-alanyl-D-alanine ligase [Planctomycetota bacterium]
MKKLTFEEITTAMRGRPLGRKDVSTVSAVRTDSRDLVDGCLFFALSGPSRDGHEFVAEALRSGAAAAVVSDPDKIDRASLGNGRLIQVRDTLEALGRLASWYRSQIAAQVIAVVGSCGKTTTKDMIGAVLGSKRRGQAARASYNNAIGVPLTLLSVDAPDEFVVVEIGTNREGEVAALGRIARPNLAVITNIGEEHLEFLGDIEAVAKEELSLLSCMRERSFVAINHDARRFGSTRVMHGHSTLTFGTQDEADLRAEDLRADLDGQRFKLNGRFEYRVPLLGRHNAINALAAIAIGTRFRMSHREIAAGLETVKSPPMRLERSSLGAVTLINDAYNANPTSMRAAFDMMDELPSDVRKVFVLGDMRELGRQAERCHRAVGRDAGRSSAHLILTAGAYARVVADGAIGTAGTSKRIYSFPTVEALAEKIGALIGPGDAVLLKASRGVRLERLCAPIEEALRSFVAS